MARRFLGGLLLISVIVMLVLLVAPELWYSGLLMLIFLIGYSVTQNQTVEYLINLPNKQKLRRTRI